MNLLPDRCTACRICEMACSFHHEGLYRPAVSSIEIRKQADQGRVEILIHNQGGGLRLGCDGCSGESLPQCIKWCPVEAITI